MSVAPDGSTILTLRVVEARQLNPLIRTFRLAAPDARALPTWSAGSHIQVQVTLPDGTQDWRHYSLINLEKTEADDGTVHKQSPRTEYTIAVRRENPGRGGSAFMHEKLQAGDTLSAVAPKNDFPLTGTNGTTVLLAGGIGVTPLTSMAAYCHGHGRPVRMCYAGRSRGLMAFIPELQTLLGERLQVHADDEHDGKLLDIDGFLESCGAADHLYVCGPKPMLDAALKATSAHQWDPGRVHFELFVTGATASGDHAFEVVLGRSGKTFTCRADQTLLDALIEHGCDPMYDCTRGECGVCTTGVLEGEIDHRDYVLSQAERDSGKMMQICVSRAKGDRIVLDI